MSDVPTSSLEYQNQVVYLHNYQFSDLEGRMLTLVETLGLPKTQEDAVKSLVRKEVWKTWNESYEVPQKIKEELWASEEVRQMGMYQYQIRGSGSITTSNKKRK